RYSESECKSLFWDMLTSAMDRHQRPHDGPKEMHLLFDANDRIGAIRYISYDGTQRDQIGFAGTPQYIPPELVNCPTYHSESSHVWGLGISLYHMLVGDYPFEETTHVQTFRQMHYSNFKLPDTLS
ncbi:uncharacterized protein EV154DRAFT_385638, partial [Mucor mucedo]|uniref:uncharacterized protein n=1 Tax=Mucor mucedo TaxID=29922 RepID=UPI00222053CA